MIGLDTNVLVRYLVKDDETQSAVASKFIDGLTQSDPGFISLAVLAETNWGLSTSYNLGREEIADVIEELILSLDLVFENIEACYLALWVYRGSTSVDFADALIAQTAKLAGAQETVTFDRRAAREVVCVCSAAYDLVGMLFRHLGNIGKIRCSELLRC